MEEHKLHIVLQAENVLHLWGFPITNSLILTWVTMAVLFVFAFIFYKRLATVPGKVQTLVEWIVGGAHQYMTEVLESEKLARRYLPMVLTIFIFVFVANQIALLPGVGSINVLNDGYKVPLFRAPSADLNFTLALAIISVVVIEIAGVVAIGIKKYAGRYINFSSPVAFVVGLIELISNLGRLISFSFRLFGNIFAGEVMILVVILLAAYLVPVPVYLFEIFVALVQAAVFAMLTLFFIKLSTMDLHGEHAH